jgi:glycosyltransferase involved in cell wall biosynthesis
MVSGAFRLPVLPDSPWDDWVRRVYIHVPHYLSHHGEATSGGRNRNVQDIARIVREQWGRECVVVQKGARNWEREDRHGVPVIGIRARLDARGDPGVGWAAARLVRPGDAVVYMGEESWPFFARNAKAFHVGIWWDGPQPAYKKWVIARRTEALFEACRSVLCVDTNIINWLRARSARNQAAANRAVYVPNCVDLNRLPQGIRSRDPDAPFRLLFARRFEKKRGPHLLLDAVERLRDRGCNIRLTMSMPPNQSGASQVRGEADRRGIGDIVETCEKDMDEVFELYHSADGAVVPTLWSEGTSYSCVEAIASGIPVVATNVGGLGNLVIPGFNGYMVAPQAEEIADAIELLTDPVRWDELHANCLSMRTALSQDVWTGRVLRWLKS